MTQTLVRGSYRPGDVTFMLKDLTGLAVERSVAEREPEIQSGRRHYSETLPVEYRPSERYERLFETLLEEHAARVATLVAALATRILESSRAGVCLLSLARAGTPVGVLLRRYLARAGVDAPHYSVSIIRDRGLDTNAIGAILARHEAASLRFVDGWTGKGVIGAELARACAELARGDGVEIDPELAVLADPARSTTLFATRDDVLIPSACLNSTVSGLVSRTILSELVGPSDFHGARTYPELAAWDRSLAFVDRIEAEFDHVDPAEVERLVAASRAAPPPDFAGLEEVRRIAREYGLDDLNLVKPGVGETTRVLLRRVPWQVLVRPDRREALDHVLVLAAERGCPVLERSDLTYSCYGLIEPAAIGSQ